MLSHCCLSCEEVSDLHLDHIRKPRSRIEMSGWGCSSSGGWERAVIGKIFAAKASRQQQQQRHLSSKQQATATSEPTQGSALACKCKFAYNYKRICVSTNKLMQIQIQACSLWYNPFASNATFENAFTVASFARRKAHPELQSALMFLPCLVSYWSFL